MSAYPRCIHIAVEPKARSLKRRLMLSGLELDEDEVRGVDEVERDVEDEHEAVDEDDVVVQMKELLDDNTNNLHFQPFYFSIPLPLLALHHRESSWGRGSLSHLSFRGGREPTSRGWVPSERKGGEGGGTGLPVPVPRRGLIS